jgi:LPS sulfotransferase NodH
MTGTADVTRYLRRTQSWVAWERLRERLRPAVPGTRFVVLTWRRTGSNLLCGMLHRHPEVTMHNELFNAVDICTYHPCAFRPADRAMNRDAAELWVPTKRDLCPEMFLEHVWSGRDAEGQVIKAAAASCNLTVGFKSFPEHWRDSGNEAVFQERIVRDGSVKKVVLRRQDELAVYVSMLRAEKTGFYLTHDYDDVRVHVDPVAFQQFLESYRRAYNRYRSPMENVDTIHITYEQLTNEEIADAEYARLCRFLGIADDVPRKTLETTVRQTREGRDLSLAIENYAELEYAFRHTEVKHFRERAALAQRLPLSVRVGQPIETGAEKRHAIGMPSAKWSLLLPICSRIVDFKPATSPGDGPRVPLNRFDAVERMAAHTADNCDDEAACWERLEKFAESLRNTCTVEELGRTECVVGIDVDDMVFSSGGARKRLLHLLPTSVKVLNIDPNMYGKMCQIWNRLGKSADGDLLLLLGDDVELLDRGWQRKIEARFLETSRLLELPLGAACVALNDVSFPGFSTFPCVHRWHIDRFQQILPRQFVNQGGDPFLFELYSRWDASSFCMDARLRNGIGGDNQARYVKHDINWRGQVLSSNLKMLEMHLHSKPFGICVDIVVPSWRCNVEILRRICRLRGSKQLNVRVWIVVDNPDTALLRAVREMAAEENAKLADGNYYIRVLFNGGGWGASCSRNTGLNYSTADWCLFLDDDVIPSSTLLDGMLCADVAFLVCVCAVDRY